MSNNGDKTKQKNVSWQKQSVEFLKTNQNPLFLISIIVLVGFGVFLTFGTEHPTNKQYFIGDENVSHSFMVENYWYGFSWDEGLKIVDVNDPKAANDPYHYNLGENWQVTEAVVAGVVYAVIRMYDIPKTLNEVSEVTGIEKKRLAKNFKYVSRKLNIRTLPIDPLNYIYRFASELNLEATTQTKAIDIIQKARKEQIVSGRSPKGLAAGALYIASKIHQEKKTQAEIAKVADVTEVTVRNTYKELINNLDFLTNEMDKAKSGT